MLRTRNLVLAALLVPAITGVALVGVADAKKRKFKGEVTLTYERNPTGTDRFFGTIENPNPRCGRGAVVNLDFRPAYEGGGGTESPVVVASAKADAQGNWEIFYEVTPNPAYDFQSYAARTPKRNLKSKKPGLKLVCKNQASERKTIYPGPAV